MPQQIQIVAQYAEDLYYGNYRSTNDFFQLSDFVYHCGNTIQDIYRQEYMGKYAEYRADKKDEVCGFSTDWLSEADLKIQVKDGLAWADIDFNVLSFPYDKQNTGYQNVFLIKKGGWIAAKRTNINEVWQFKFLPNTDEVFFYPTKGKLNFFNKGSLFLNNTPVKLYYVPSVSDDMLVPDGIINQVIVTTVAMMKNIEQGVVVKKSIDENQNKVMETEMNKMSLK